jgi:hypothetical protein
VWERKRGKAVCGRITQIPFEGATVIPSPFDMKAALADCKVLHTIKRKYNDLMAVNPIAWQEGKCRRATHLSDCQDLLEASNGRVEFDSLSCVLPPVLGIASGGSIVLEP